MGARSEIKSESLEGANHAEWSLTSVGPCFYQTIKYLRRTASSPARASMGPS